MPVITAAIDPVTRIEGHLKVNVEIDTIGGVQQVVDVHTIGTLFRGFEKILENRDPRDAPIITSRICGVCPTSHAMAAVLALDQAFGVTPPAAGRILRNLVHGACYLESAILHFYLLCLPDFVHGPGMAPWQPGWDLGGRLDKATEALFLGHYLEAINVRRTCHEMGAIFGGKLPHTPAYVAGGFTAVAKTTEISQFQSYLNGIVAFVRDVYLADVERLASLYPEYFGIGRGYGNLLSYGAFELNDGATQKLFDAGRVLNASASVLGFDQLAITEHVAHSWYDNAANDLHPSAADATPVHPKGGAYSWLKAPRYNGVPYECGPLARMWVLGEYTNGVSAMDRHRARAYEALKLAVAMQDWLTQLIPGASAYTANAIPASGTGIGLTEAPRGALGHWLSVASSHISHYQVITPTCWTISPRDTTGQLGPLEKALMGVPVANADKPIEVLRVIHSVDPCLDCATHVIQARNGVPITTIGPTCGTM
jgi:hydrogenase large subunit